MEERLVPVNRAQRRAAARGKKAAALGSGLVLAAAGASTAITLASSAPAVANTPLVVDSLTDDGTGFTLREAIEQANTDAGQDTITFSVSGTITLASNLPNITEALQIQGPGAAALTVDGADQFQIFNFYDIDTGVNEVSGVTLTHGVADVNNADNGSGGAIFTYDNAAPLTIANAVITDNYADNDGGGVGLYDATGSVVITGTTISDNVADEGGGALYIDGQDAGALTVTGSTVTGNRAGSAGGGLYTDGTAVIIENSTINFNTTDGEGGGVYAGDGSFTMTGTWVGNNTSVDAGGGLYLYNTNAVIEFSTITGNQSTDSGGGGIFFYDDGSDSTATIRNSTISNNTAQYYGGGLYFDITGQATIENSTISGNTAAQAGGVYGNYGGLTLTHVTITNNTATNPDNGTAVGGLQMVGTTAAAGTQSRRAAHAEAKASGAGKSPEEAGKDEGAKGTRTAGVRAQAVGAVDATGTIIAGNAGQDVGVYSDEVTLNSDHSLIGTIDETVIVNDLGGSQLGVTDPGLLPLADNGGPTQTHALAVGSPAKDTGENPVATFPGNEFDQRGQGYARVVDGTVDIGAFEQQAPLPVDIAPKFTG